jgi:hypothetical protein
MQTPTEPIQPPNVEIGDYVAVANAPPLPGQPLIRPILSTVIAVGREKIGIREVNSGRVRDNVWPLSHPRCKNADRFGSPDMGVYELAGPTKKLHEMRTRHEQAELLMNDLVRRVATLEQQIGVLKRPPSQPRPAGKGA